MQASFVGPLIGALLSTLFLLLVLNTDVGLQGQDNVLFLQLATIFFALAAILGHLIHFVKIVIPKGILEEYPRLATALRSRGVSNEMMMKQSASFKINNMVINALKVSKAVEGSDNVMDTYFGQNLLGFSKVQSETIFFGGFGWVVRNIWNKDLLRREGIWIPAKNQANALTMFIISFFLLWTLIAFTERTMKSLNDGAIQVGLELFIQNIVDQITAYIVGTTLSDQTATGASIGVSNNIANVLLQNAQNSGIDCNTAFNATQDLLGSTCVAGSNCSLLDENFLCSLSNTGGSVSGTSTLELLEAAGFNFTDITESVSDTLNEQVAEAINKYFPDNINLM